MDSTDTKDFEELVANGCRRDDDDHFLLLQDRDHQGDDKEKEAERKGIQSCDGEHEDIAMLTILHRCSPLSCGGSGGGDLHSLCSIPEGDEINFGGGDAACSQGRRGGGSLRRRMNYLGGMHCSSNQTKTLRPDALDLANTNVTGGSEGGCARGRRWRRRRKENGEEEEEEEEREVFHRSPVSIDNGYRPVKTITLQQQGAVGQEGSNDIGAAYSGTRHESAPVSGYELDVFRSQCPKQFAFHRLLVGMVRVVAVAGGVSLICLLSLMTASALLMANHTCN
jgi:hypothetical protein